MLEIIYDASREKLLKTAHCVVQPYTQLTVQSSQREAALKRKAGLQNTAYMT